jgi:hypothetical protein
MADNLGEPGLARWQPVPGGTVVRGADGTIPPLTLAPTPGRLRVRLRESENLPPLPGAGPPDLARRTVFVDTVVLPAAWST